jgi:isopentenyldiphosphate isomerase
MNGAQQPQKAPTDQELLPVVDEEDREIDVRRRRDVHLLGLRHRSVQVCIVDGQGRVWLQRRGRAKDCFPGWWDLAVTGHVDPGESYDAAALRELREELGIEGQPRLIGRAAATEVTGWEFQQHYLLLRDGPFDDFSRREIEELRPFGREELRSILAEGHSSVRLTPGAIAILPRLLNLLEREQRT